MSPSPLPSPPHNIDKLQIMGFYVVSLLQREMSRCDICKHKECGIRGVLSARKSLLSDSNKKKLRSLRGPGWPWWVGMIMVMVIITNCCVIVSLNNIY